MRWVVAAAVLSCSNGEVPAGASAGGGEPTQVASAEPGPSASAAPAPPTLPDASDEERTKLCTEVVTRARAGCASDDVARKELVSMCEKHPVWECAAARVEQFVECWVPPEKPSPAHAGLCEGWADRIRACDLEATIRKRCPGYVKDIVKGGAAEAAGLRAGDHIALAQGRPFTVFDDLAAVVQKAGDEPLELVVDHPGERRRSVSIKPKKDRDRYVIGVYPGVPPSCDFLPLDRGHRCKR